MIRIAEQKLVNARRHCVPTAIRGRNEKAPTLIID